MLSPLLNSNGFSVRNSFEFVSFVTSLKCRENGVMVSFDFSSLFTKVPVSLAIEIASARLSQDTSISERTSLSVQDIVSLLTFCLNAAIFSVRFPFLSHVVWLSNG